MGTTDKPILNFTIDPDVLSQLEDFRFKHRFPSRAAAVKWMIEYVLRQKSLKVEHSSNAVER